MELHSRVFKVALASAVGLFTVIGSQAESSADTYRYLCTSVPAACEYAPQSAPTIAADVCWDGSAAYLKGTGSCASGSWPYHVLYGEVVDPGTNEVAAYIPLDDACDLNYCTVKPSGAGPTEPGAMCCGSAGCTDLASGSSCGGNTVIVWCLEGEEATNQNGSWVCYEPED
jgi:hypothetical protein